MRDLQRIVMLTAGALLLATVASAAESSVPLVSTRIIEPIDFALTLAPKAGVLIANEERTLAFDVMGRVAVIGDDGARIVAGASIAVLDSELEKALLRQAELRLKDALSQLARTRGLSRSGVVSERALESAETLSALFEAERDAARELLARRTLTAEFSGDLVETFVEPGEIVSPGLPVGRFMDLETLRVKIGLPGYQVLEVRAGSQASIHVPSLGAEIFEGVVLRVARAAAEGEHLFEVELEVPNSAGRLRPGMVARVEIVATTLPGVLRVPVEAIVAHNGERVVFFVRDGVTYEVPVAEGRFHRDLLLLPNTVPFRELVVRGQGDLSDGIRVRVDDSIMTRRAPR